MHSAMLCQTFAPRGQSVRSLDYLYRLNNSIADTLAMRRFGTMLSYTGWKRTEQRPSFSTTNATLPTGHDTLFATSDIATELSIRASEHPDEWLTVDALLCFRMLCCDADGFLNDYLNLRPIHNGRHFQEALIVAFARKGQLNSPLAHSLISHDVITDYNEYIRLYTAHDATALKHRFSSTFWYYVHSRPH